MLDVVHYLFEDDTTVLSEEEHDSKSSVREVVYRSIYNREFAYTRKNTQRRDFDSSSEPFDEFDNYIPPTTSTSTKPYVPPTNFDPDAEDPFGGILRERPMG